MKVVSNTGPLSTLGKLGKLDLLGKLYGEILIPPEVHDEIAVGVRLNYRHCRALAEIVKQGQLRVVEVVAPLPVFQLPIDLGEIGAIALAWQEKADLILIDDRDGRDEAERLKLKIKGTVGILLDAFERGNLSLEEVEKLLKTAGDRDDIWISKKITQTAIATARKWRNPLG